MILLAHDLAVIRALQERKQHLTIVRISHRTEIPRAIVHHCLHTLMQFSYATIDGRTYSLLPKVPTLGHAYLSSASPAITIQPILDRLSEQPHKACSTATLEGDDALHIARSATPQRLASVNLNVGSRLPAYCTSMGRILLAVLGDGTLHAYFGGVEVQAKTSCVLYTPKTLLSCLVEIRRQDWRIVDQELRAGLHPLAMPVHDSAGHVFAMLNVGAHAGRVSRTELENRFLPLLLEANRELGARLFT